jgi:hypothetical protein
MAYGDFSLSDVVTKFGLTTVDDTNLFATVPEALPSDLLRDLLARTTGVAMAIGTEKAKSELITAQVLFEVRERLRPRASLFSGNEFSVDPALGLTGYCDFILSRGHEQEFITAPVMVVIEAKNDNLKNGLGQCAAGMIAARVFNERKGNPVAAVHGAVTSGLHWRFLRLVGSELYLDKTEYHIRELPKVLGILFHVMRDEPVTTAAA